MENKNISYKKAALIAVILLIILFVACIAAWIYNSNHAQKGSIARIYQNGILIEEIDLSAVTDSYQIRIDGESGAYNIIEIRSGEIGIVEASCPDKICIHTGFIDTNLLPITCLPNHLVIQVETEEANEMDAIAF